MLEIQKPIEKLQIRNFRAHKKLDINFSPLVNSIIGRNAIGKSTIIRAIRWVVKNKPAGDSVINWDANKAAVRLTIDGNKVTRTRGKSINTYRLNKKLYKAFRNDVPKDIEKVINLSDINFQGQHEAPFWFSKTAGEVSRQLNTIINLEVIDSTLSNIDSALRNSRIIIAVTKNRLDKSITQKKSLAYAEQMDKDLEKVENLQKQHQEKTAELVLLQDISKLVQLHRSEQDNALEQVSDSKLTLAKGLKYQKITVQIENQLKTVKSIESLIEEIRINKEAKCQIEKDLRKHKRELEEIAGGRCPLCGAKKKKS